MKRFLKPLALLTGAVIIGSLAFYARGWHKTAEHPPAAAPVAPPPPAAPAAAPAGSLEKIEILTPDPVILSNMDKQAFMSNTDAVLKAAEAALSTVDKNVKLSLTVIYHHDKETDNVVVVAEKADEPVAKLLADAVDRADKDVRTKLSDVSVRFHFDTSRRAPAAAQGKTLVIVPKEAVGPGEPVAAPKEEKEALAAAAALALPPGKTERPWTSVICNPSFWKRLHGLDAALATKGTPTTAHVGSAALEARSFLKKKDGLDALYQSPGFQKLMGSFAAGKARAATKKERAQIYALIPFEIKGLPATVIEKAGDILFISVDKQLLWLDVISDYDKPGTAIVKTPDVAPAAAPQKVPENEAADRKILSACSNEIGLYCHEAGEDVKAVKACLGQHPDDLLPSCKSALR